MKNWFDRYSAALGDYSTVSDGVCDHIKDSIIEIGKYRVPEISVVMIAYNEQERILPAIWSLSQMVSRHAIEIVVVDNASSDQTATIIHKLGARYVYQQLRGVGNARQAGLEAARGRIILSADADTFYPPTYADAMVEALGADDSGISCVFTSYWFFADGKKSQRSLDWYSRARDVAFGFRAVKRPELAVGGAAMAFRRADALQVGWKTDIRRGEDGAMLLGLKRFGRARFITGRDVRVRSTSRTLDADGSLGRMITKRVAREAKRLGAYFKRKDTYKDQDYNKL